MKASKNIPKRVRTPDSCDYILVNKQTFTELVNEFLAVLEDNLKFKHEVRIYVEHFTDSFNDVNDFTEELRKNEWINLRNVNVYFYPIDKKDSMQKYSLMAIFGDYSNEQGLIIKFGDSVSDIEMIAIKQGLDSVLSDHERSIILKDQTFGFIVSAVIAGILVYLLLPSSIDDLSEMHIGIWMFFIAGIVLVSIITNMLAISLHRELIPHFESTMDLTKTRWNNVKSLTFIIFTVIGVAGSIIGIIQFIF